MHKKVQIRVDIFFELCITSNRLIVDKGMLNQYKFSRKLEKFYL